MRFSVLNLLLLGTVLAVTVQDVVQIAERTRQDGVVDQGLIPPLPRALAPAPKPVVPKPKPPVNGPDAPGSGQGSPGGLRPNEPAKPPNTTPDQPGLVPGHDPKPPANKPGDANILTRTSDDIDGPVNLPEACGLKKRCVGDPPFEGAPDSWKTVKNGKEVDYRVNGYQTHKTLDEVITGKKNERAEVQWRSSSQRKIWGEIRRKGKKFP